MFSVGIHITLPTYRYVSDLPREKFKRLVDQDNLNSQADSNQGNHQPRMRSRMEQAFPIIGGSYITGWTIGGLLGFIEGRSRVSIENSRTTRRTQ